MCAARPVMDDTPKPVGGPRYAGRGTEVVRNGGALCTNVGVRLSRHLRLHDTGESRRRLLPPTGDDSSDAPDSAFLCTYGSGSPDKRLVLSAHSCGTGHSCDNYPFAFASPTKFRYPEVNNIIAFCQEYEKLLI